MNSWTPFFAGSISRIKRIQLVILPLIVWCCLGWHQLAWAETTPLPQTCRVGIYLLSLRDFNPAEKTFGADFWAWSICPVQELKPLESMEVINAKNVKTDYDSTQERKDQFGLIKPGSKLYWSQRKISATLQQSWNTRNFPFDRHQLEIPLEESALDTTTFVYTADTENSSYKQDMKLEDWVIQDFRIRERKETYQTTFGDPELKVGASDYSQLSVLINIKRKSILSFIKMIVGVYAAFATTLLSFFLAADSEFGSRASLLVGSLFATLVSMKSIDTELGQAATLTLVDAIHIIILGYIIVAVVAAVYSRRLYEQKQEQEALRFDRKICFGIFAISFFICNTVLITNAFIQG